MQEKRESYGKLFTYFSKQLQGVAERLAKMNAIPEEAVATGMIVQMTTIGDHEVWAAVMAVVVLEAAVVGAM